MDGHTQPMEPTNARLDAADSAHVQQVQDEKLPDQEDLLPGSHHLEDAPAPDADTGEILIPTPQHTFLFDRIRRRFRRLPRGASPHDPSVAAAWEPYFGLEADTEGALTVQLDAAGTRRLRVMRRGLRRKPPLA
jgi:hypothetical protein